jgi:hypothetical protein
VYSLVSAPVMGFDLCRTPGGPRAAQVLHRALTLTPDDLPVLAAHHADDADRLEAWLELSTSGDRNPEIGPLVSGVAASVVAGSRVTQATLGLLEAARIGDLGGLLRCIRHDVFDWAWSGDAELAVQSEEAAAAVAVVCDAAAAAYAQESLSEQSRRRLGAGWWRATRELPTTPPALGPQGAALEQLLARVRRIDAADRDRLTAAIARSRRPGAESVPWSQAVHDASWAVHLSGRVRAAAAAQLLLVEAVSEAGVPVEELAAGSWNLLSGATQALVVRDVADAGTLHPLLAPLLYAIGPVG